MSPSVLRAPSRPVLALCVCLLALLLPASRAAAEPGIRILNALETRDLALNALTTNRQALKALNTGPLNSKAFEVDERLKHQLRDGAAFNVMGYLVGCALPPGSFVEWTNPATRVTHAFKGEAGLCPEWEFDAPKPTCLGYVTACLLARNNAYGSRVPLSMRGEHPRAPELFNPSGAAVEWSPMFLPCPSGGSGLAEECGWVGEGVGSCTPGASVTVGAGAPYPSCTGRMGDIGGDRVLRVCEDPAGCARADRVAEADQNACGGIAPSATFTCPATGRYSIMSAPYDRAATPGSWVFSQAYSTSPGTYPSGPFGAFTFREGAFFGNLFDPYALAVEVLLTGDYKPVLSKPGFQGYPYQKAFACYSRDWVSGDSHLSSRICANAEVSGDPAYACLARTVGPCEPGSTSTRLPRCAVNDGSKVYGDGDFEDCRDESDLAHLEPITSYLRSPCDVLPGNARQVCTTTCSFKSCSVTCRPKSATECLLTHSPQSKPQ